MSAARGTSAPRIALLRAVAVAAVLASAVMLIVADLSTQSETIALTTVLDSRDGGERHLYALLAAALAAVALVMQAARGSRSAVRGILITGAVATAVALSDVPGLTDAGGRERFYDDVRVDVAPGFATGVAGALLMLAAGLALGSADRAVAARGVPGAVQPSPVRTMSAFRASRCRPGR